jgi:hypothetical protein
MEVADFVHRENLRLYKKQLTQVTNEARRRQLFTLLIEEEGRDQKAPNVWDAAASYLFKRRLGGGPIATSDSIS